ncbi:hypothetical protein GYMLUDRAFT_52515 [Collybiopsis luxurians FD-317 M1]|nr:hypothetical protein GYMLUDRAFT_52515 [Collybiopsis luxurians FD-317 M1]
MTAMDHTQNSSNATPAKLRRPLPVRPSTPTTPPVASASGPVSGAASGTATKPTTVVASSFYADPKSSKSQSADTTLALPTRPSEREKLGSASTTYTPPSSSKVSSYSLSEDYRPPEVIAPSIAEDPRNYEYANVVVDEEGDEIPPLTNVGPSTTHTGNRWGSQSGPTPYEASSGSGTVSGWGDTSDNNSGWGAGDSSNNGGWGNTPTAWDTSSTNASAWTSSVPDHTKAWAASSGVDVEMGNYDLGPSYFSDTPQDPIEALGIRISNRTPADEERFWDQEYIASKYYPGPGMLAPVVCEEIGKVVKDSEIFKVEVQKVELSSGSSSISGASTPSSPASRRNSSSPPPAPTSEHPPKPPKPSKSSPPKFDPYHVPPSREELQSALPHPNAYYSPKENAWMLLYWGSSSSLPPLAKGFTTPQTVKNTSVQPSCYHSLPDQKKRLEGVNCLEEEDEVDNTIMGNGKTEAEMKRKRNLTHHYHKYAQAVDASKLDIPFPLRAPAYPRKSSSARRKQSKRGGTLFEESMNLDAIQEAVESSGEGDSSDAGVFADTFVDEPVELPNSVQESPLLLDLYLCCQCSFYVLVSPKPSSSKISKPSSDSHSEWTPASLRGVVPLDALTEYIQDRLKNPIQKATKEFTIVNSLETLLIIIQNHLFKGEARNIKVNGPGFERRLGWNEYSQKVLGALGFTAEQPKAAGGDIFLRAPPVFWAPPNATLVASGIEKSASSGSEKDRSSSPAGDTLNKSSSSGSLTPVKKEKSAREKPHVSKAEVMLNRRKLLRGWVEISAWLIDYKNRDFRDPGAHHHRPLDLYVNIKSARESYQRALGAHVEQIPRGQLPETVQAQMALLEHKFIELGLTPMTYSPELLVFAYLAGIRCDPTHTPTLYTNLMQIMQQLIKANTCPEIVQNLFITEDNRGRWTRDDVLRSVVQLGFSVDLERLWMELVADPTKDLDSTSDLERMLHVFVEDLNIPRSQISMGPDGSWYHEGPLKMDYYVVGSSIEGGDGDDASGVPDHFVENAWKECMRKEWEGETGADVTQGGESKNGVKNSTDALRIVAQARGSTTLMALYDSVKGTSGSYGSGTGSAGASPYAVLEVPREIDDGMLITVYQMRVDEQPSQLQKMQHALYLIAQIRNSARLKEFTRTSRDPGDLVKPTRPDWPRGLNQLGNTCYLNSLLQYFYTIKELRSSVITTGSTISTKSLDFLEKDYKASTATAGKGKAVDDDDEDLKISALTDDDLKRHRVGGRLVTRREIMRSKQFVSHLANLFHSLEYADNPAVTPSIELAKLALVTSKDEEDDDVSVNSNASNGKTGTDASNDTDATLVEESGVSSHPPPTNATYPVTSSSESQRLTSSSSPRSPPSSPLSPTRSPSSVLGKRTRVPARDDNDLDFSSDSNDFHGSVSPPPSSEVNSSASVAGSTAPVSRASSKLSDVPESSSTGTVKERNRLGKSANPDTETLAVSEDVDMRDASPMREPSKEQDSGAQGSSGEGETKKIPPPLPPRKSAPPVQNDSVMMFGKQHDVAECMDNCMFQIETALLKFDGIDAGMDGVSDEPEKGSIVKCLFYGKIRQAFIETLKGEPTTHQKEDLFSHLPVNVGADAEGEFGFDIYDGLGRYFDDTIEYEGQKVPMEVGLVKVPPLLQVQLQRVQFNRELLQSWKSQAYVKFGETLYMDRFMDTADPEKRKRSKAIQDELNSCRERLKLLTQGKANNILFSQALETTSKYLAGEGSFLASLDIPLSHSQLSSLQSESSYLQAEIAHLRNRIPQLKAELEDIWRDEKSVAYELTSVFIHRGSSPSFGHYFLYSRNLPDKPDEWFKYNDEEVTEITKEEVLKDTTGETANPYLLVFARKGSQVVETVNRFTSSAPDQSAVTTELNGVD